MKCRKLKKILVVILTIVVVWAAMLLLDYNRVFNSFKQPLFALLTIGMDDGGSGTYQGIAYSFEIKGNFMPEEKDPGVTEAEFYLFGHFMDSTVRD